MIARRLLVTGRVQGVFFRAWTRKEARTQHVSGWVRNCGDGSVEAQLEGEAATVEALIDLIREGPPGAQVDHVEIEEADREGLSGFEIRL
ncbi:MAG TPA: acylphosphatase [Sphingomicrobium sp.]|jgi:acylphosphatase